MIVHLLDLDQKEIWSNFLELIPAKIKDIYFTPEYYQIYENLGDGKAFCFVFEHEGEIAIYPFLLNKINTPFFNSSEEFNDIQGAYGYNGILSSSDDEHFIALFYSAFNEIIKTRNIIAEFTRFHPILNNNILSENYMTVINDRSVVYLNLQKKYSDIMTQEYSGNNRNMIKKAIKEGVEIELSSNFNDYLFFYKLYIETMQNLKAESYYLFSEKYISDFYIFLNTNQKLILAKKDNMIICGALIMTYGEFAHYHLSARTQNNYVNGANNLVLDYAVKYAQSIGCKVFHFGGGSNSKNNNPLFQFKSNFSKDRRMFKIGKKVHNKLIYDNLTKAWEITWPDKIEKYKNHLLKYNY